MESIDIEIEGARVLVSVRTKEVTVTLPLPLHSACANPAPQSFTENQQERSKKKMPRGGVYEAKFWRTPELVENLLGFLDGRSALILARCHHLTSLGQGGQENLPRWRERPTLGE